MGLTNCEICGGELYGSAEVRRCNNCRRYCHHCSAKDSEIAKLRDMLKRCEIVIGAGFAGRHGETDVLYAELKQLLEGE